MRLSTLSLFAFSAVRSKMTKREKGFIGLYVPIMVKEAKEGAEKGAEAEVIKEYL